MDEKNARVRTSKRNFIIALFLLLLTNILMGMTLMTMSKKTLREQINQRMLDVANTAAYQLDGDVLMTLKAEDEGTEGYQKALDTLRSFQDNIELDYIYGIRAEADGTFTFTIDPTVEDPGEFGSPIKTTEALKEAAKGKASVDQEAYTDAWGRFYSAYSPVFDSKGEVAGIVAVDFNAEWYDGKLSSHRAAAVILTMAALTIGIVLSFIIMSQNRKRFASMLKSMAELDREAQKLDSFILKSSVKKLDMLPDSATALLKTLAAGEEEKTVPANEYDELNTSISAVYGKLHKYLQFVENEFYTDATTCVQNKAAYKKTLREIDAKIADGTANISVAFFDINRLKTIYTHYGFEAGEKLLFECAKLLKTVFGQNRVYHVTGDEFIIILEGKTDYDIKNLFAQFDDAVQQYNIEHMKENHLSVAKGFSVYNTKKHKDYRGVFVDAKADCDRDKAVYYGKTEQ